MGSEWQTLKIGELGKVITGKTPSTAVSENFFGNYPFITIPDLDGRREIAASARTLSEIGAQAIRSCRLPAGAVMMSCIATIGKCGITTKASFTNQQINSLICRDGVDPKFVYYSFSQLGKALEAAGGGGSVYTNVSKSRFESIEINLPPLSEQRAITHILGTLDDKIELNRQQNKTLEKMAQALFKAWFVDFEPVRAKMEGRWQPGQSLPGLPAHLYDLFPDRLVETEQGEIPQGWRMSDIKDCCMQVQNGGTPRRSENLFWEGGTIPWLTSGEVRQAIIAHTESFITEAGLRGSSAKWIPELSTVVALYGATAGQVSLTSFPLTTNQAVCALIPKDGFSYFNYLSMRNAVAEMEGKAVGSAQQNISKGIVEKIQVIYAHAMLMEKFSLMVEPFFDKWISNLRQSRTLAQLRDTLLPKLISGELRASRSGMESIS